MNKAPFSLPLRKAYRRPSEVSGDESEALQRLIRLGGSRWLAREMHLIDL
jgi:hypothetical protein